MSFALTGWLDRERQARKQESGERETNTDTIIIIIIITIFCTTTANNNVRFSRTDRKEGCKSGFQSSELRKKV